MYLLIHKQFHCLFLQDNRTSADEVQVENDVVKVRTCYEEPCLWILEHLHANSEDEEVNK